MKPLRSSAIPVEIDGRRFQSIADASMKLDMPVERVVSRLGSACWPRWRRLAKPVGRLSRIVRIDGRTFASAEAAASELCLKIRTVKSRLMSERWSTWKRVRLKR